MLFRDNRREAEAALKQHARHREGAAGDGAGAERQHRRGPRRAVNARAVALERPEVRQHPVRGRDRLRALQCVYAGMSVAPSSTALIEHHAAEASRTAASSVVHASIAHSRVAVATWSLRTAAGVQLGGDVADLLVQQPVDQRVHVLVGGDGRLACGEATRDRVEPALDARCSPRA